MLRKFMIIAASTALLTFGGAFSTTADAHSVEKNLSYKVYYSINGETGTLTEDNVSNLVKKALERIQSKYLTNDKTEEIKNHVPTEEKKADKEEPTEQVEEEKEVDKEEPAKNNEEKEEVNEQQVEKQEEQSSEEQIDEKQEQPATQPERQPEQQEETQQPTEETGEQSELSQFETEVVELTNAERAKNGLSALQIDEELSAVAREKSKDMASNQYFDHNSPVYGSPFDMMGSFGINYRTAGENIAMGQRSPQEVVDAWMNSPGHRANILNGDFTHIGVGFVEQGNHWTQMFIGK